MLYVSFQECSMLNMLLLVYHLACVRKLSLVCIWVSQYKDHQKLSCGVRNFSWPFICCTPLDALRQWM